MGLSDSILRQALSDNTGEELVMQEIKRVQQVEKAKQDLLGDPSKLDNLAAALAENYTPSMLKPKNLSKFSSKAEGVDSNIPEDHPFAGMGREMKGRLEAVLADPQYKGVSADELVQRVGQSYLMEPAGEGKRPRIEQAYRYKREKDAGLKMSLNPFSEDSSLRKLPGYEQWHEATRGAEDEKLASESWFASSGDLAEATVWGAGVGAAIGAVTGGPVGAAVEGGIGAVASPILEVFAHPVRRALQGTEWYRSKISSDSGYENAKALGFEIATDIGIAMGGVKAGSKLLRKSTKAVDAGRKMLDGDIRKLLTSGRAQDATAASNSWKNVHGAEIEMKAALDRFRSGTMEAGQWQFYSGRKKITGPDDVIDLVERDGIYEMASDVGRMIKGEQRALPEAQKLLTAPEEVVTTKALTPKKMFNKLTDRGADKALKEGVTAGDLDGAITKVFQEESVVLDVVKKEANDFLDLLTTKKPSHVISAFKGFDRITLSFDTYAGGPYKDIDELKKFIRDNLPGSSFEVQRLQANIVSDTRGVNKVKIDFVGPDSDTQMSKAFRLLTGSDESFNMKSTAEKAMPLKDRLDQVVDFRGKQEWAETFGIDPRAKEQLQNAGYNLNEIHKLEKRKLLRLVDSTKKEKAVVPQAAKQVSKFLDDVAVPAELTPEAQGIFYHTTPSRNIESIAEKGIVPKKDYSYFSVSEDDATKWGITKGNEILRVKASALLDTGYSNVKKSDKIISPDMLEIKQNGQWVPLKNSKVQVTAEEAVSQADKELASMVSDAESTGYLEAMLESGKLKAAEIIKHEGPVTSSSAIDIPAAERMIPQEALIEDFIYDKLEDQFAKKYGDQFWHWTSPEVYDKVVPDEKAQAAIQKGYEFLQKKYGYDLKTMVPSKQKAILKYGSKEGHEKIEFENSVKEIRSLFDGEKLLGPLGVGMLAALTVPITSLFSVDSAEAAGFSSAAKVPGVLAGIMKKVSGAGEEAKVAFMKGLREGRYIPGELKAGQKTVDEKYFGRQMHIMEDAKKAGVKTKDMFKYKKPLPFGIHNLMSPAGIANVAYKTGFSVAIQRAHLQTLWAVHTRDMTRVVENILRDVPGYKSAADEIANMTKPFVDKYASVQAARAMEHRLKSMETAIERLQKKALSKKLTPKALRENDEALNKAEMGRELLRKEFDRMKPTVDQFDVEFGKLEQDIAKKFSSARIFYAAEDTSDFSLRPWLRGMVSYEEEIAAGHIKSLMDVYAKRMLAGGHKVITDRPFMHHTIHPKYQADKAQELLSKVGINVDGHGAFTKFFKREKYSKSFVPDIQYTMNKYIPDAEKRILVSDFWRKRGSKEFRQGGWYSHMRSYEVQNNKMLSSFWNRLYTADEPEMRTVGNRLANWYTAFETAALIGFSPATAFKHVFKNQGTWGQLGFANAISHVPEAIGTASRNWLNSAQVQDGLTMRAFRKLGIDTSSKGRALDKFADAMIHQHKMMHYMSDMQVPGLDPGLASKVDNMLFKFNQKGSFMVAAIESFDRAHSFHAALDMAVNKGMSGKQAVYGIFDTILKNNFLGGGLNPEWMRKPVVRAVFLFQNTPFKIMERRLVNGIQTYQNVKTAIGVIKKQDLRKTLGELRDLKRYIKSGEDEIKKNLIGDALFHDKDVFGTPVTKQFMREFIYVGATIYGLGSLFDADFHPHSFHVPFISTFGGDKPELGVSPMAGAIYKGLTRKRESVDETGQEVGWVSQFFQDWLGRKQFVPQTFYKLNRISENDIPEAYKDSSLRYLFAVPSLDK